MDHRARFSTLSAKYDDFLYAPVCEDANGVHISVLSALARMNVDPWEEATRLAAMPRALAEKALLSILDLVSGRSWKSPEAAAIVAQLVRLLPPPGEAPAISTTGAANPATRPAKATTQRKNYWLVWLGLFVAMSFMILHRQATPPTAGFAASDSVALTQLKSHPPDPTGQSR